MPKENDLQALELTREERTILKALIDSSLTARELAKRIKIPIASLTKREHEVLEKATKLLGGTRDASSLKIQASHLSVLEALLRESSVHLEKYPGIAGKAGRAAKSAAAKVTHPLHLALEKYLPEIRQDPNAAPGLAQQAKGLLARVERFREELEIRIRIKDEPEEKKSTKKK